MKKPIKRKDDKFMSKRNGTARKKLVQTEVPKEEKVEISCETSLQSLREKSNQPNHLGPGGSTMGPGSNANQLTPSHQTINIRYI